MLNEPGSRLPNSVWLIMVMASAGLLVWTFLFFGLSPISSSAIELDSSDAQTARQANADSDAQIQSVAPHLNAARPRGKIASKRGKPAIPLLPMRIRLELERAAHLDRVSHDPPLGSGRDARMSGQLSGSRGGPLVGDIHVIAGPNRGRMTSTEAAGRFEFVGLYPGLALVELRRSGETIARRQINLHGGLKAHLHVAFGHYADVAGRVVDTNGEPIEGAEIRVDGRLTRSNANGRFVVADVAGGRVPIEAQAIGFARDRRLVNVRAGSSTPPDELEVRLEPEVRLQLTTSGANGSAPTKVWVLPGGKAEAREKLWPHFEAFEISGQLLEVRGLPAGPIIVHADRVGARLYGGVRRVPRIRGMDRAVDLPFVPAAPLKGTVMDSGVAVNGAIVELFAADPLLATKAYLGLEERLEQFEFLPLLSPMAARTTSDASGDFALNVPRLFSTWQRLVVTEPSTGRIIERAIKPDEERVLVDFNQPVGDRVSMEIAPSTRTAPLPYELFVHGKLRQSGTLEPGENLKVDSLVAGEWQVRITQGLREIVPARTIRLDGETRVDVELIRTPVSEEK
ncbi:MAG: hypothetical protein ACI87A_000186 [Planctomycetota bacterium]|jgi:hypothetical protein